MSLNDKASAALRRELAKCFPERAPDDAGHARLADALSDTARWEFSGSRLYPIAEADRTYAGSATKVRATRETRPPKKGEWFLSGAEVEGYFAHNDLATPYTIAVPVSAAVVKAVEKCAEEIAKAETEAFIRDHLGEHPPRQVTVFTRSTEAAWLTYGDRLAGYGKEGGVSWSELLRLVATLPPIPAEIRKDGCTSIVPESRPKKDRETCTPIAPVWFSAHSPHYSDAWCEASWFSEIPGVGVVKVGVYLRREDRPLEQVANYKRDRSTGTVVGILSKSHRFPDWWNTGGTTFRYAGGGGTDPGTVVRYFERGTELPTRAALA
jgi:hypothetical protein